MGILGFVIVIGFAIVVGLAVRFFLPKATNYESFVAALAALFGGLMGSEMITGGTFLDVKDAGPAIDGLVIVPALVIALVLIVVSDYFVRSERRASA